MDRASIKEYAKERVKGNRWLLWKAILIIFLITFLFVSITAYFEAQKNAQTSLIINLLTTLLVTPLSFGLVKYFVAFEKKEDLSISYIFDPYKKIIKLFVLNIFMSLIIVLGTICLIVPGIILSLSYSAVPYLFNEHKDLSIIELLSLSRKMMKGHKFDYFVFELSFLGWQILSLFTCGILYIWFAPYYMVAQTKFFVDILENYEKVNTVNEKSEF